MIAVAEELPHKRNSFPSQKKSPAVSGAVSEDFLCSFLGYGRPDRSANLVGLIHIRCCRTNGVARRVVVAVGLIGMTHTVVEATAHRTTGLPASHATGTNSCRPVVRRPSKIA